LDFRSLPSAISINYPIENASINTRGYFIPLFLPLLELLRSQFGRLNACWNRFPGNTRRRIRISSRLLRSWPRSLRPFRLLWCASPASVALDVQRAKCNLLATLLAVEKNQEAGRVCSANDGAKARARADLFNPRPPRHRPIDVRLPHSTLVCWAVNREDPTVWLALLLSVIASGWLKYRLLDQSSERRTRKGQSKFLKQ